MRETTSAATTVYVVAADQQSAEAQAANGQGLFNDYWRAARQADLSFKSVFAVRVEFKVLSCKVVEP